MKVPQILIIDDDAISNNLCKKVIDKINFADKVVIKTDAFSALNYLSNDCNDSANFPDLIFVDLKMPAMDGFDFLEQFEFISRDFRKDIAIVILTQSKDPDDYVRLKNLGTYYTLPKPLTTIHLEDIYHRFFRNKFSMSELQND